MRLGFGLGLGRGAKQMKVVILQAIGMLLTSAGKYYRTSAGKYFNVVDA
jgi:hypothetical protein|tara:strand:- start:166 stop:312 length:147 start_codon:yes stop_codon:yes gene_type:complete